MKKIYFLSLIALTVVLSANGAFAQTTYTKQVIIVNGGDFGNPDDFVTVASYDPETGLTTEFATIFTQSVQDVIINGNFAYVAAQDSIVKLNIDTYEKVSAVPAAGVNQLATNGEFLVASFWFPVTENFVKIFSLDELSLISNIDGISGDAAGILINGGIALVAVPGAWGSTTGKIASIDLEQGLLLSEDDYGEFYSNVGYFGFFKNEITTFMKTPWGETEANSAIFDMAGEILHEFTHDNTTLANKTGQKLNNFYAEVNNGIAQFNLQNGEIVNAEVVAPQAMTIAASVLDSINNLIYLTTTDYFSTGEGFIYNLDGEQIDSFDAGISAQAIAVDYRNNTGISNNKISENISLFPNPSNDKINFRIPADHTLNSIVITDISGKTILIPNTTDQIDISSFTAGLYFININTDISTFTGKFIKQ